MLSVTDVRALLGDAGAGKSDAELEQLIDSAYAFARLLVDSYLSRSASSSTSTSVRRVSARRHSNTLTLANTEGRQCSRP